ncbi:inner-membrane translocator [Candidatus Vecturithrix granuli]|uniref:Inner-membrane translocator n=1 Tax=Vecturithrix granuli TaxID=1499967 RepID=A0A0S6WA65_VECG1|nr:inner-membrane translocator [Candidatus Vecturithrix granuli]
MSTWEMRLKSESFQKVLWPIVALVVILLFNLFFTKGFFRIEVKTNFELTEKSLRNLEKTMPAEVIAKLERLKNQDYTDEKNFLSVVQETIGEEQTAQYKSSIMQHVSKEKRLFGSLIDILNRGAPTMLLTIGMTLVYATGGIDLSVGSVLAISGAMAAYLIRPGYPWVLEYPDPPTSILLAVCVPLLIAMLAGLWNGFLVAYVGVQPIIATLILMVAGRGIAQLITQGQIIIFVHEAFEFVGGGFLLRLPFPVILVIVMLAITYFLTRKTALGMFIEAVGANPTASRFMGLQARQIKLVLYMLSGLCAGIAGLIICSDIRGADANNAGLFLELDAIASVIIGGTMAGGRFRLAGSMFGALIIQSLTTTILTRGVPPEVTLVYKAIVIILVVLIQSENFRRLFTQYFARMKMASPAPSLSQEGAEESSHVK